MMVKYLLVILSLSILQGCAGRSIRANPVQENPKPVYVTPSKSIPMPPPPPQQRQPQKPQSPNPFDDCFGKT